MQGPKKKSQFKDNRQKKQHWFSIFLDKTEAKKYVAVVICVSCNENSYDFPWDISLLDCLYAIATAADIEARFLQTKKKQESDDYD